MTRWKYPIMICNHIWKLLIFSKSNKKHACMKGNTAKVAKIKRQQVVEKCHSFYGKNFTCHANENPCDKEFLLMDFRWQRISSWVKVWWICNIDQLKFLILAVTSLWVVLLDSYTMNKAIIQAMSTQPLLHNIKCNKCALDD